MESNLELKPIQTIFAASERGEGVGAKVRRFIGVQNLPRLDPFLMLDWFNVALPAGFPDHPHRGFETVTYMLSGSMYHEDFKGHKGAIGPGDIQWMTAGKGILHAEMPASFDEPSNGFQLWINLDKKSKYCEPKYQEFKSDQIPIYKEDSFSAKVIAGEVFGVKGPIKAQTPAYFIDFTMPKEKSYEHVIPKRWNSMIIVHNGSIKVQDQEKVLPKGYCAAFKQNESEDQILRFTALEDYTKFILLAGQPLDQPVAWHGPFVLNEEEEIDQTFDDYSQGKNGFEGSTTWKSDIRNLKNKNL